MGEDIKSDLAGIAITHPFFADMVTNALNYIEELEKENKELKEDNEQLDAIKNEAVRRYNFETVPKSKVKEKIEELKEIKQEKYERVQVFDDTTNACCYQIVKKYDYEIAQFAIKTLQELLREE